MMLIRTCTRDDIKDLLEVLTISYLEHYTYLWIDNGISYINSNFDESKIDEEMANPNAVFFLIIDAQKPVGLIKLNVHSKLGNFSGDEALELERIYFTKESVGKGLGKKSIELIKDFAKQKGKKIVWLKAMDSSTVVEFYQKQGFAIVGETYLNYPEIKSEFRKMFIMRLAL